MAESKNVDIDLAPFRLAVEHMSDGLALFGADGGLVFFNEMFLKFNPEQAGVIRIGVTFEEMLRDNLRHGRMLDAIGREEAFFQERMERHRSGGEALLSRRHDGRWLLLRDVRTPDGGVILINTDLTSVKEAEARLQRAQRLQTVGELTGGVAHDFNNLLSTMVGSVELLSDELADNPSARRYLAALERSIKRGASLTDRLLSYSRQQALRPAPVVVSAVIGALEEMLKRTLGEAIDIEVSADADLWPAMVDAHQFENAILNLALNARDAMPCGGRLTISAGNVRVAACDLLDEVDVAPGDFVRTTIADTGGGIPEDIVDKVFDPFFTTKEHGQGSGLGLSMVYGFARQSGGFVELDNTPGEGVAVSVYLLRSASPAPAAAAPEPRPPPKGVEHVLIVEDDDDVRQIAVALLETAGYAVTEAARASEGLAALAGTPEVALAITDLGLPGGTDGYGFVRGARRLRPGLKFLMISGYPEKAGDRATADEPPVAILPKPFKRVELLEMTRRLLDEA